MLPVAPTQLDLSKDNLVLNADQVMNLILGEEHVWDKPLYVLTDKFLLMIRVLTAMTTREILEEYVPQSNAMITKFYLLMVDAKTANLDLPQDQTEEVVLQYLAQVQEKLDQIMHAYHVIHTQESNRCWTLMLSVDQTLVDQEINYWLMEHAKDVMIMREFQEMEEIAFL